MEAKSLYRKHLSNHIPDGEYRSGKQLKELRNEAAISAINEVLDINRIMYEALDAMLSRFEHSGEGMIKADHVKSMALAALKKAKGE